MVTEYRLKAHQIGWGWGKAEHDLGTLVTDIWYDEHRMAVEVDTGTEGLDVLKSKAARYRQLQGTLGWIVFVTGSHNTERIKQFLSEVTGAARHKAGGRISDLGDLLVGIQNKRGWPNVGYTVR